MLPVHTRTPACPFSQWDFAKQEVPELTRVSLRSCIPTSNLRGSLESSIHPSEEQIELQCQLRWEKLRRQEMHPAAPVKVPSSQCNYSQHLRRVDKCSKKLQEAPHAVRGWSVIPTAKIREGMGGRFMSIISRQHTRGFQWAQVSKTSCLLHILSQDPHPSDNTTIATSPLACYRGQVGEKRGVCVRTAAVPLMHLRLLGWGGGQARSTFKNFVIFKNGLKWRVVFWHRGVFLLALPSSEVKSPSLSRGRSERIHKVTSNLGDWELQAQHKTSFRSPKPCVRIICLVIVLRWVSQMKIWQLPSDSWRA